MTLHEMIYHRKSCWILMSNVSFDHIGSVGGSLAKEREMRCQYLILDKCEL